jgi:hypothetical protein
MLWSGPLKHLRSHNSRDQLLRRSPPPHATAAAKDPPATNAAAAASHAAEIFTVRFLISNGSSSWNPCQPSFGL